MNPGLIHPAHLYLAFGEFNHNRVTLSRFFELLDTLDAIDRNALISLVAFGIGVQTNLGDTEDARREHRYRSFRQICSEFNAIEQYTLRMVSTVTLCGRLTLSSFLFS